MPNLEMDEDLLPAFLIGYEGEPSLSADAPAWLHAIQHQYGGHACVPWNAIGYLLPLTLNQREGTGKLWLLTRALTELGESWPGDPLYSAPEVAGLTAQIGKLIQHDHLHDARAVDAFSALLTRHLAFPGMVPPIVEGGSEALIRFRETDPSPFFDGWRMVCRCTADAGAWHGDNRYNRDLGRELQSGVGRGEPPRIFLLWENSD